MGTFIINTEPQQFARKFSPEVEKKLPAIVQKGYCVAESKKKVSYSICTGKDSRGSHSRKAERTERFRTHLKEEGRAGLGDNVLSP